MNARGEAIDPGKNDNPEWTMFLVCSYLPLIPAKAGTQVFDGSKPVAFYTYIMASGRNGTLYTGSTDNLLKRIFEHKQKTRDGFSAKYGVNELVWYEPHETRATAFRRERQIKKWNRLWKLKLIEDMNPRWMDLSRDFNG